MLAALAVVGLLVRALVVRRGSYAAEGASAPLQPFKLGRVRVGVETALWLVLIIIAVLPLIALLASSLSPALGVPLRFDTVTLANYRFALSQGATLRAFANSFMLALIVSVISAAIAVPLAYLAILRKNTFARAIDLLADAPYAVPGTVLAIAVIIVFLPPLPLFGVSLYGTMGIILVAYLARFLALALRPTVAGMELVNKNVDEAAQIAGAGVITRLRAIILPAVAPSAAAGALLIFMTAFNELTVSALLWSTGLETLGVVVFTLAYEGNSPAAAAVATISIAVTLALAFLASTLGTQPAGRSGAVAGVSFSAVAKHFGATRAVDGVSLDIADGEFFALLGPSGCGKTTLLRLVAGFEVPDGGDVKLGGEVVGRPGWALPPERATSAWCSSATHCGRT